MGIDLRVLDQVGRQRTLSPVGPLIGLVDLYAEVLVQDSPKPDILPTQNTGSDHGVKDVGEGEAEVPLEHHNVIFSSMEHLLDTRIGQGLTKKVQFGLVSQAQRIDQKIDLIGG